MSEFKMSRNGSGYYDETAYNGMNQMPQAGEVWTYTNNGSIRQREILIIKNHGTFCTALNLLDEEKDGCIAVTGHAGFERYTDTRMIQYIYNTNVGRCITELPKEEFEAILHEISLDLGFGETEKANAPEHDTAEFVQIPYGEMVALFGAETVAAFCRCAFYVNRLCNNTILADEYMQKLNELEGDFDE